MGKLDGEGSTRVRRACGRRKIGASERARSGRVLLDAATCAGAILVQRIKARCASAVDVLGERCAWPGFAMNIERTA